MYATAEILAQAQEIVANQWDWHPHASLPPGLGLCAYDEGIYVVDFNDEVEFRKFIKLERICDSY